MLHFRFKLRELQPSQSGYTLIEVLAAAAIGVVTISILAAILVNSVSAAEQVLDQVERNELVGRMRRALQDRRALQWTINNNPIMDASIRNDFTGSITGINSNTPYGISLYDASGELIAGPQGATGATDNPIYFTEKGEPCMNSTDSECAYALTAAYMIQGLPHSGTPYDSAPSLSYPVAYRKTSPEFFQVSFKLRHLKAGNLGVIYKDILGSVFVDIHDWGKGLSP